MHGAPEDAWCPRGCMVPPGGAPPPQQRALLHRGLRLQSVREPPARGAGLAAGAPLLPPPPCSSLLLPSPACSCLVLTGPRCSFYLCFVLIKEFILLVLLMAQRTGTGRATNCIPIGITIGIDMQYNYQLQGIALGIGAGDAWSRHAWSLHAWSRVMTSRE